MTFAQVLALGQLVGTGILDLELDAAQLAAGETISTPQVQVGTEGGKPLYASIVLTTAHGTVTSTVA